MILLRLISWPYLRKHVLRWLLTVAGIVLGVAVFVGMHVANQSVLAAFHATVDRIAGATELQVTAGDTGFDEDVLERVQAVPEVRVAVPVIEAVVDTGLTGQGDLLVLAVDMTGDRSLRDYDFESGDEDVIEVARGAELYKAHNALAVAWEGVGGARASAFSNVPYLEIRGATDTANHEAPVVFDANLKIVMRNLALLLYRWLGS